MSVTLLCQSVFSSIPRRQPHQLHSLHFLPSSFVSFAQSWRHRHLLTPITTKVWKHVGSKQRAERREVNQRRDLRFGHRSSPRSKRSSPATTRAPSGCRWAVANQQRRPPSAAELAARAAGHAGQKMAAVSTCPGWRHPVTGARHWARCSL